MTHRANRSISRWLRAYPARWRAENSAAIRGTLLDELTERGLTTLTWPKRLDLLRGGAVARWREASSPAIRSEVARSQEIVATVGLALIAAAATALALRTAISGHTLTAVVLDPADRVAIVGLFAAWPLGLCLASSRTTVRVATWVLTTAFVATITAYVARALAESSLGPLTVIGAAVAAPALVLFCFRKMASRGEPIGKSALAVWVAATPLAALSLNEISRGMLGGAAPVFALAAIGAVLVACVVPGIATGRPALLFCAAATLVPLVMAAAGLAIDALTTIDDPRAGPSVAEMAPRAIAPLLVVAGLATILVAVGIRIANRSAADVSAETSPRGRPRTAR